MKKFLHSSEEEIENKNVMQDCIFVFDTNILLHFYTISEKTFQELFDVLNKDKINERLWIPNQVIIEFFRNRETKLNSKSPYPKIESAEIKITELISNINTFVEKDQNKRNMLENIVSDNDFISKKDNLVQELKKIKEKLKKMRENASDEDKILEKICETFNGKTGTIFSYKELCEIEKEGEYRYREKIPPGYKDNGKVQNKFGDLIIWKEIIKYGIEKKKCLVFVTNENKKDWWNNFEKRIPNPYLISEFYSETQNNLILMNFSMFLDSLRKHNHDMNIDDETILQEREHEENNYQRDLIEEKIRTNSAIQQVLNPQLSHETQKALQQVLNPQLSHETQKALQQVLNPQLSHETQKTLQQVLNPQLSHETQKTLQQVLNPQLSHETQKTLQASGNISGRKKTIQKEKHKTKKPQLM